MAKLRNPTGFAALGLLVGSVGCSPDTPTFPATERPAPGNIQTREPPRDGEFLSNAIVGGMQRGPVVPAGSNPKQPPELPDDPGVESVVAQADIVQLSGDRLYTLSRFAGLTIVDVSNPSALRRLGGYRSQSNPFAMYVDDGIVYALFNGWNTYSCDADGLCSSYASARVRALDTRDPTQVRVLADREVPGFFFRGSQRVGNMLYVVSDQSDDCSDCAAGDNTRVSSFDLSDPSQLRPVDELSLNSLGYSDQRRVSSNEQRLYITGYDELDEFHETAGDVQVVDISDPSGKLVAGAHFQVAGPIYGTWQMNESDGVLRVLSQPGGWGFNPPPLLETFRVVTSSDIERAGSVTVQVPGSLELVQDAHFDGARAYVTTSIGENPLLTFDLSDPAAPRETASLDMPGYVYHMEGRGNRLFVVGNDPSNPDGSLHVSLYDVENLDQPRLLDRLAFGGDSERSSGGQNRTHTAFSVLPDPGLLLIPFSPYAAAPPPCGVGYGGIQVVGFSDTGLTARGAAALTAEARRVLLHGNELLGVGDSSAQAFDISNPGAAPATAHIDLARDVTQLRAFGDRMLRLGRVWDGEETLQDLTPSVRAAEAQSAAELDLPPLPAAADACEEGWTWGSQVFSRGDYAYVPRYGFHGPSSSSADDLTLYIVDLHDPNAPRVAGALALPSDPAADRSDFTGIVQTDNALLVGRAASVIDTGPGQELGFLRHQYYDVIDLRDPSAPVLASRFEIPQELVSGGWGALGLANGTVDLGWGWYSGDGNFELASGDLVVSQHDEYVPGDPPQAKYYLDRLDVSDPDQPKLLEPIEIPGLLLQYQGATNQLITVDFVTEFEATTSPEQCTVRGFVGSYDSQLRGCRVTRRNLSALQLQGDQAIRTDQVPIDDGLRTGNIAVSGQHIFYISADVPPAPPYANDIAPPVDAASYTPVTLESLELVDGQFQRLPSQELRQVQKDYSLFYELRLYAREERAFALLNQTLTVVDLHDPATPGELTHALGNMRCSQLEVAGNAAYCAAGEYGVEVVDLSSLR